MKLTKNHIRQWVEALRSGEYKQGNGNLCAEGETPNEPRYCCLGVACDIFLDANWERDDGLTDRSGILDIWSINGETVMPPVPLENAINKALSSLGQRANTASMSEHPCEQLATWNDSGRSFKQIASYIEKAAGL